MKNTVNNLKKEITESLQKYIGIDAIDILHVIREDIQTIMNSHISELYIKKDFPIRFSNEMGDWEIHEDGTCFLRSKKMIQSIYVDFTITRTGDLK